MAISTFPPASGGGGGGGGANYTFSNPTETLTMDPGTYKVTPWVTGANVSQVARLDAVVNNINLRKTNGIIRTTDGNVTVDMQIDLPYETRTSGVSTNWYAATYGNGIYVIGGDSGNLRTSTDTVTWTARTSGFGTSGIRTLIYAGGLFVAGGVGGTLTTSTDGITWTSRTSGFGTTDITGIAYGNGRFVAVGEYTNRMSSSTDGITWSGYNLGTANQGIAFGQGAFFVVGGPSGSPEAWWSTTGTSGSWTSNAEGYSTRNFTVAFGNDTWVVGGETGRVRILAQYDAKPMWTQYPFNPENSQELSTGLVFVNGKFVSGSDKVETLDGLNYRPWAGIPNNLNYRWATYGNGRVLLVGNSNVVRSTKPYSTVTYGATFELLAS